MTPKFATGESNFATIIEKNYTFIDKSLFIRDVMDDGASVLLFTRPRRFGKSLNLSMLGEFLSLKGGRHLFQNLLIAQNTQFCSDHQNQYPVLSLSFKDCKYPDFDSLFHQIQEVLSQLYIEHEYILQAEFLSLAQKEEFCHVRDKQVHTPSALATALSRLMLYVRKFTSKKVVVLIDEYDTPLHTGYIHDFYDPVMHFMRALLSSALKDNLSLEKGVISGITRVAQESLFSGLNNLDVYTIFQDRFSQYFGFLQYEVQTLLPPDRPNLFPLLQSWYNGYTFGSTQVYNPWSIIQCLKNHGELDTYWMNTSDNSLVYHLISKALPNFKSSFLSLLDGSPQKKEIEDHLSFLYLQNQEDPIWTLLTHTGYLTSVALERDSDGIRTATLSIPNKEIRVIYIKLVREWFQVSSALGHTFKGFIESLARGDLETFSAYIAQYILEAGSCFDFHKNTPEVVFHVFILGVTIGLQDRYTIRSNREVGLGRADLILIPLDPFSTGPSLILEFKSVKDPNALDSAAAQALQQISSKKYATAMVGRCIAVGMAFCGKQMVCQYRELHSNMLE